MQIVSTSPDIDKLQGDERLWAYNCFDTCVTLEIFENLQPQRNETYEFEKQLLKPTLRMMERGFRVNHERRAELAVEYQDHYEQNCWTLNHIAKELWGYGLNPDSPKQMCEFLYDEIGFRPVKVRAKGVSRISANREAIEKLQLAYPVMQPLFDLLLEIRDVGKSLDLLTMPLRPDGRFSANFKIAGTETGRFSSSADHFGYGQNLQNVPKDLREIFLADEGMVMIQIDLQGAESRGVAYISGDPNYIAAVEGGDVHTIVSAMTYGHPPLKEEAEKNFYRTFSYRDMAKKLGHGSNYYGKPYTMAKHAKVEKKIAEDFQQKYFEKFPGISQWHIDTQVELQTTGAIKTPHGWSRQFLNRLDDEATLREAIAFKPQNLIARLMNQGIINIDKNLPSVDLLAQVHDAVVAQVSEKEVDKQYPLMLECLDVPVEIGGKTLRIPADGEWGYNWGPIKYDKITKQPIKNLNGLRKFK
jgi:DNA polymerase-1